MVHVLELLGCDANGKTMDEALAATPDAIRAYLTYLARHGEAVDPGTAFRTRVAERLTEGDYLGRDHRRPRTRPTYVQSRRASCRVSSAGSSGRALICSCL